MARASLLIASAALAGCGLVLNYDDYVAAGAAAGEPGCGTISLVADDFEDPLRTQQLFSFNSSSIVVDSGALVVKPPFNVDGSVALVARNARSLANDGLTLHVSTIALSSASSFVFAIKTSDYANSMLLEVHDTAIIAKLWTGDVTQELGTLQLGALSDVEWLRIRNEGATVYWEASVRGAQHVLARAGVAFALDLVLPWMWLSGDADAQVRLSALDGLQAPGDYCKASDLTDAFWQDTPSRQWRIDNAAKCIASQLDGALKIDELAEMTPSYCSFTTLRLFDLRSDAVAADLLTVPPVSAAPQPAADLTVANPNGTFAQIVSSAAGIALVERSPGDSSTKQRSLGAFSPGRLYFRETGGAIRAGRAAGGQPVAELPLQVPLDPRQVEVRIGGQTGASDATATFDNYNIQP